MRPLLRMRLPAQWLTRLRKKSSSPLSFPRLRHPSLLLSVTLLLVRKLPSRFLPFMRPLLKTSSPTQWLMRLRKRLSSPLSFLRLLHLRLMLSVSEWFVTKSLLKFLPFRQPSLKTSSPTQWLTRLRKRLPRPLSFPRLRHPSLHLSVTLLLVGKLPLRFPQFRQLSLKTSQPLQWLTRLRKRLPRPLSFPRFRHPSLLQSVTLLLVRKLPLRFLQYRQPSLKTSQPMQWLTRLGKRLSSPLLSMRQLHPSLMLSVSEWFVTKSLLRHLLPRLQSLRLA